MLARRPRPALALTLARALTIDPARPRPGDLPGDRYFRAERTRQARATLAPYLALALALASAGALALALA